jgi:amino acid transporter
MDSSSPRLSPTPPPVPAGPRRELSLFDSTCLIVGIIVGAGIYEMAPAVARGFGGASGVLAIWMVGGLLSLCGALGYAELATAYPRAGGDYVYLARAYGPWAGFLFGWAQLAIVRPGDIAVMAFIFATYAQQLWDPFAGTGFHHTGQVYAIGATVVLTLINVLGVSEGKWTQNLLTVVKTLGLLLIVGLAFVGTPRAAATGLVDPMPASIALIFVLFAFGGWNEMAYVAAEVKEPRRNIVRALVIGTTAVTLLYVLANAAFLHSLGYVGMTKSKAVATDTVATVLPALGGPLVSALICISTLGAVNGLVFAGARISFAVGADHRVFRLLGQWHPRTQTPVRALLLQGAIAVALIAMLGTALNAILYTASTVYSFYLATTVAVFVLRRKEPQVERPYRVSGYPVTPLIFSAVCVFLAYSAITYKPVIALAACGLLVLGLLVYALSRRLERQG